jgi:hypothetical protein
MAIRFVCFQQRWLDEVMVATDLRKFNQAKNLGPACEEF